MAHSMAMGIREDEMTMNEMYPGDGTDHTVCEICGMCITCEDCECGKESNDD